MLFCYGLRINTLFCNYPTVEIGAESIFFNCKLYDSKITIFVNLFRYEVQRILA